MQDFNTELVSEPLTDMSQFPGDKAGVSRAELEKFKLIRGRADSGGCLRTAAFAVHDEFCPDRIGQAALFSASSSLSSSSRVTFFSVTLASSRMKSTTLSS